MVFPSMFKGEHIKQKDVASPYERHNIFVEFDSPRALQIDGETVKNVLTYSVAKQLQERKLICILRKEFLVSLTIII